MSFAPPKVEEKETNITKPIIPSLKLDEIKDEKDLDQEGKIEGKTNVQQEENNITEKTQQELSSKIDETLNDNDTIITAKDTESPIKKTTFHMPNQTARKKIAAASITPDPALRIEYTDRLLAEYTNLKSENNSRVTLDAVLEAVQYSTGLLRTLDDCAQWSSRDRFETYRDIFVALQMEKEELNNISDSKEKEMSKHSLSFEEFQSIFPGPRKSTDSNVDPMPQKFKKTPTPDPDDEDNDGGKAAARTLLGKLAAVPRKEIPKHSLRDRIRHAHITGILHLTACGLKYFPGDGEFTHYMRGIKVLSLNRNQLTILPAEMAYLPLLEHLSLSYNLLESLPDSISSMQNLKALDVSQNRIRYLPPAIGNLRNIQVLSANQNKLKSLPYSLGKLKTLQRLNLNGNPLFPVLVDKYNGGLPVLLAFLEAISTSIHEANILGTKPYGELETEEDVFKNELLLSRGEFGMVGTIVDTRRKIIDYRIKSAKETGALTLEHINLRNLSDDMVIPEVKSLRMARNRRLTSMPLNIKKFVNLIRLDCRHCGIKEIPFECHLGKISTLEYLDLSENALEMLPGHAFKELDKLKVLDVSKNKLMNLPIEISRLKQLRTFVFHTNPIPNLKALRHLQKESGIPAVQAEIIARVNGYVSTVDTEDIENSMLEERFLIADKNHVIDLSRCGLFNVPDRTFVSKYYSKVTDIVLAKNHLTSLPDRIANMYRIRRLDVSYNDLNEVSFPPQLMHIRSIVQLNISHNRLAKLPELILEFKLLRTLNVSNNQLKDIPFGLRNLKQLENLAIENNPLPSRYIEEASKGILDFMDLLEELSEKEKELNPVLKLATARGDEIQAPRSPRQLPNTPLVQKEDEGNKGSSKKVDDGIDDVPKYVYNRKK